MTIQYAAQFSFIFKGTSQPDRQLHLGENVGGKFAGFFSFGELFRAVLLSIVVCWRPSCAFRGNIASAQKYISGGWKEPVYCLKLI